MISQRVMSFLNSFKYNIFYKNLKSLLQKKQKTKFIARKRLSIKYQGNKKFQTVKQSGEDFKMN